VSWEKPWQKPFESLLSQFSANFKGEITRPKPRPETRPGAADTDYFVYPIFKGELSERKFIIEVSEFPRFIASVFEAADNVEYLRIFVIQPSQYALSVIHENWLRRFKKKLRIDREFQTGRNDFDEKYYLRPEAVQDKQLLKEPRFQELVKSLEPFSVFEIQKSGILWSQQITDENQLAYYKVEGYLKKTLELAELIASR
jgi:hypothetical protein